MLSKCDRIATTENMKRQLDWWRQNIFAAPNRSLAISFTQFDEMRRRVGGILGKFDRVSHPGSFWTVDWGENAPPNTLESKISSNWRISMRKAQFLHCKLPLNNLNGLVATALQLNFKIFQFAIFHIWNFPEIFAFFHQTLPLFLVFLNFHLKLLAFSFEISNFSAKFRVFLQNFASFPQTFEFSQKLSHFFVQISDFPFKLLQFSSNFRIFHQNFAVFP